MNQIDFIKIERERVLNFTIKSAIQNHYSGL